MKQLLGNHKQDLKVLESGKVSSFCNQVGFPYLSGADHVRVH